VHRLYAVNYADRTLSVIDTADAKVIHVIPIGDHPQAIAIDAKRNRVYVANVHGNSVTVIDTIENTVLGTFPVDEHPYALAVDETTGQTYAAVYGSKVATHVGLP
jgi:YVTN family beta-propeller protein